MKKIIIPITLFTLLFSACKTSQLESYQDDVYASPAEEKRLAKIAALEKLKKEEEEKKKQEAAVLAQKAKDDANPYYQDPQYNSDDYYDYKYASQIRRFKNPVNGAGYYNNYYTNSYMYNQNPGNYGSSIYNSYNWWMPSNQFSSYNNGLSLSLGNMGYNNPYSNYGNGGYSSFGYNPYTYANSNNYYNGYNNFGYSPYSYNSFGYNPYNSGYMNGYSNGYNNGFNWGYFNSYDVNSSYSNAQYGARGSNGGGNSIRNTSAGMAIPEDLDIRSQFIKEVVTQQEVAPKFTEMSSRRVYNTSGTENLDNNGIISSESNKTRINSGSQSSQYINSDNSNTTKQADGFWPRVFGNTQSTNSEPIKSSNSGYNEPIRSMDSNNPQKIKSSSIEINNDNSNSLFRTNNSGGSNFGGGTNSSPRGSSSESNRPR